MGWSDVLRTVTVSQQPSHTSALVSRLTLKNCSAAAGVTIISDAGMVPPSMAMAREISPTVPPVGTAMFAPNATG